MGTEPVKIGRAEALAEAYKRGLLPPQMKSAYEEAQKRGLVGAAPAQPNVTPLGGAGEFDPKAFAGLKLPQQRASTENPIVTAQRESQRQVMEQFAANKRAEASAPQDAIDQQKEAYRQKYGPNVSFRGPGFTADPTDRAEDPLSARAIISAANTVPGTVNAVLEGSDALFGPGRHFDPMTGDELQFANSPRPNQPAPARITFGDRGEGNGTGLPAPAAEPTRYLPQLNLSPATSPGEMFADGSGQLAAFMAGPGKAIDLGFRAAGTAARSFGPVGRAVAAITPQGSGIVDKAVRYGGRMIGTVPENLAQAFTFGAMTGEDGSKMETGAQFAADPLNLLAQPVASLLNRAGIAIKTMGARVTPESVQLQQAMQTLQRGNATPEQMRAAAETINRITPPSPADAPSAPAASQPPQPPANALASPPTPAQAASAAQPSVVPQPTVSQAGTAGTGQQAGAGVGAGGGGAVPPAGPATLQATPRRVPAAVDPEEVANNRAAVISISRFMRSARIPRNVVNDYVATLLSRYEPLKSERYPLAFFVEEDLPQYLESRGYSPDKARNLAGDVAVKTTGYGKAANSFTGSGNSSRYTMQDTIHQLTSTQKSELEGTFKAVLGDETLMGRSDEIGALMRQNGEQAYTNSIAEANRVLQSGQATAEQINAAQELNAILTNDGFKQFYPDSLTVEAATRGKTVDELIQERLAADPIDAAHWLQSKIGESARDARNSLNSDMASTYEAMRKAILDRLEQFPGYRGARMQHGDLFGADEAISFGDRFLSVAKSEFQTEKMARELEKLSPRQQQVAALSIRDALLNQIIRLSPEEAPARITQLQNEGTLKALVTVLGEERGNELRDAIASMRIENQRIAGVSQANGSPTHLLQQGAKDAVDNLRGPGNRVIHAAGNPAGWGMAGAVSIALGNPLPLAAKGAASLVDKLSTPTAKFQSRATRGLYGLPNVADDAAGAVPPNANALASPPPSGGPTPFGGAGGGNTTGNALSRPPPRTRAQRPPPTVDEWAQRIEKDQNELQTLLKRYDQIDRADPNVDDLMRDNLNKQRNARRRIAEKTKKMEAARAAQPEPEPAVPNAPQIAPTNAFNAEPQAAAPTPPARRPLPGETSSASPAVTGALLTGGLTGGATYAATGDEDLALRAGGLAAIGGAVAGNRLAKFGSGRKPPKLPVPKAPVGADVPRPVEPGPVPSIASSDLRPAVAKNVTTFKPQKPGIPKIGQTQNIASVTTKDGRQYDVTAEVFKDRDAVVMSPSYPSNIADDLAGAMEHQQSAIRAEARGMKLANDAPRAPDWAEQNPAEWGDVQRQVGTRFLGMVNSTPGPHILALVDGVDINSLGSMIQDALPKGKVLLKSPANGELAVVDRGAMPEQFQRWDSYNPRYGQSIGQLPPPAEWASAKPAATSAPSSVTPLKPAPKPPTRQGMGGDNLKQDIALAGAGSVMGSASDQENPQQGALLGMGLTLGGKYGGRLAGKGLGSRAAGKFGNRMRGVDQATFGGIGGARTLAAKGEARPLEAIDMAEQMAARGASRDEIWDATAKHLEGTRYAGAIAGKHSVDGKPRFEIDDSGAQIVNPARGNYVDFKRLKDRMTDADAGGAYPPLADMTADFRKSKLPNGAAQEEMTFRRDPENPRWMIAVQGPDAAAQRSIALHERQHIIQQNEGFASGASPDDFIPKDKQGKFAPFTQAGAFRKYRRTAGETEARNVEARKDFTPEERRAKRPWKTQDVPDDQQIVRFGSGKAESRPKPPPNRLASGPQKPKREGPSTASRMVAGGVIGGIAGSAGSADPQDMALDTQMSETKAQMAAAQQSMRDLQAILDIYDKGTPQQVQETVGRGGKYTKPDGVIGPDTSAKVDADRKRIAAEMTAYAAQIDKGRARIKDLEEQQAYAKTKPSAQQQIFRELGPLVGALVGVGLGAKLRGGAVKKYAAEVPNKIARANALLTSGPLNKSRSVAAQAALRQQPSNINEFWIQGGAKDKVPFELSAKGKPVPRRKSDVMPPSKLFPTPRFRSMDIGVIAGSLVESGAAQLYAMQLEGQIKEARELAKDKPTEANLAHVQALEDQHAVVQALSRLGAGIAAGRAVGALKMPYPSARANVPAADAERALLLEHFRKVK